MAPPMKGEPPDLPLTEFAVWYGNHESEPGDDEYTPYLVTLTTLAIMANVSLTAVRNWLVRPGFPKRDAEGLVDAYQVWKWKSHPDDRRNQTQRRR